MRTAELRQRFLQFFQAKGHTVVPGDSLIPSGDPTVLFTSAGMNQFKDYFLGTRTDLTRAASAQPCVRTGDLDRVGRTPYHHTFFEMLGNFSFGDYFKRDAIAWGWEFLTGTLDFAGRRRSAEASLCLSLPASRLWVSIYEDDEEAFEHWRALGIPQDRIRQFGPAENFWPSDAPTRGPNGPCGPCSELYVDPTGEVGAPGSVEVWNLVFTQFDRQSDGGLKPLPRKHIDTGMGLERLAAVVQGVASDYETDGFRPIVEAVRARARAGRGNREQVTFAERAVADHLRAIVFMLAEGLAPSNESRGYVLRMLIRRASRLGRTILRIPREKGETFLAALAQSVETAMSDSPYAELLAQRRGRIQRAIEQEERQFVATLETGMARLDALIDELGTAKLRVIPGAEAFKLYDTYGVPVELTADAAEEHGLSVDQAGFEAALRRQQERSRAASPFGGDIFVTDAKRIRESLPGLPAQEALFVGYETLTADGVIRGLWDGGRWVNEARAEQTVGIILDRSPFYGEAGGQAGDRGAIEGMRGLAEVGRTIWVDDVLIHHARIARGSLSVQETVQAQVDGARRLQVARSHTATHLLHWALRTVLGPDAVQAGSAVDADRLRFDFTSGQPLTDDQRHAVEGLVRRRVRLVDPVHTDVMELEAAKRGGALAMFGEKYARRVRVVTIGDYSKELCGGTHLPHTGFVGTFSLVSEGSIAAGTRRVEALVGEAAAERAQQHQRILEQAARRLGRPAEELVLGLEELLEQLKRAEKDRRRLQLEFAKVQAGRLVAEGKQINGVTFVTSQMDGADREVLTVLADSVRGALKEDGIVVLAASEGPSKASMVMAVTPNMATRVHAGELLKAVAALTKGSGGGRPDFAQAGGKDPSGIPAALARAEQLVREALAGTR